jgi:1,4-alpha-glucan branching enzyme
MSGRLAIVLHAHLPYVRHPEHPHFHEESWLFEAVAECYLPLLAAMAGWNRDGVPWRLTLTLTPTLCAMLSDELLCGRTAGYLEAMVRLSEKEVERNLLRPALREVAEFHEIRGRRLLEQWHASGGHLLSEFRRHQDEGNLEILTCAATHALLPLWLDQPFAIRAQLAVAVADYRHHFGRPPDSLWLPECAWDAGLDPHLAAAGLRRSVLETHGLLYAEPRPRSATFAPVITPAGLTVFGRDPASARQVWSRNGGYPGDPRYREFHQDLAHEAEWEYLRPHQAGTAERVFTGIKYHRVTGGSGPKEVYSRAAALASVQEHARHFVAQRNAAIAEAAPLMPHRPPLLAAPFDAELFGHWWFEGPEFLDAVVRTVASEPRLRLTDLREDAAEFPERQAALPARSSWGEGGHLGVWLDAGNAWMLTPLRSATGRMLALARRFSARPVDDLGDRLLRQAGRELLLAQSSDWPFLLKMGTAGSYPAERFRAHVESFNRLAAALESETGPRWEPFLRTLEDWHPLFPELDWRLWCDSQAAAS